MSQAEALHWLKRGIAFAKGGDKAAARPLVCRAVELDPSCEPAWMWLAGLAESAPEALAALERVLVLNPANGRARAAAHSARLQAGVAAAKAHQKTLARGLLRTVVAAEPESEPAWMWLASVAESPAEAETCLDKVLALNPANERAGPARLGPRAAPTRAARRIQSARRVAPAGLALSAVPDAGARRTGSLPGMSRPAAPRRRGRLLPAGRDRFQPSPRRLAAVEGRP